MVQNDKNSCLSCFISRKLCVIYLSFMLHLCKMIISPGVFFSFWKFWFFRFSGGWKCKKLCKMTKSFVCHAPYLSNHTSYDCHMVHLCKVIISPGFFFIFFKILIFQVVKGVKGQKMVQNDKKLCPSGFISQELYIIWLSFMAHLCKMIIYLGSFFIFSKFWFFGLLVGGGGGGRV